MLGEIVRGKVIDENEANYFVQIEGTTYELPKVELTQTELPKVGAIVQGFTYEDLHRKAKMTQFLPSAQQDQYGWGKVTDIRRDLGVFVDVGLPDKEMVVSLDDLPWDETRWPRKGDRLLIRLETDEKNRIWGKLADDDVFQQLSTRFPTGLENHNVTVTVYSSRPIGAFVITSENYLAFVHESEMTRPLRLGEKIQARVIGVGKYGRLNLSVLPRDFEEIDDDAQMILVSLKREATQSLPFYDKSDPREIEQHFGISKSAFKRALGNLLKHKLIREDKTNGTITLEAMPENDEN